MKIIVLKDLENDCILYVASIDYLKGNEKSESDVEKAIKEYNMVHPDRQYTALDCSDEVYEAIRFILGESQYGKAHSIVFYTDEHKR